MKIHKYCAVLGVQPLGSMKIITHSTKKASTVPKDMLQSTSGEVMMGARMEGSQHVKLALALHVICNSCTVWMKQYKYVFPPVKICATWSTTTQIFQMHFWKM